MGPRTSKQTIYMKTDKFFLGDKWLESAWGTKTTILENLDSDHRSIALEIEALRKIPYGAMITSV